MLDLLLSNEHRLGRLIAQIAHGAGIPMTLFRFDGEVTLPPSAIVDEGFKTFVERLHAQPEEMRAAWMGYARRKRFDIFASGRRYEHPFITLLRNEPWWSVWELGVLHGLTASHLTDRAVSDVMLPGSLGELVQMRIEPIAALSGLLLYGPVPREKSFTGGEIRKSIARFVEAAQSASEIPNAPNGGGFSSYERLRRMYFANGRTIDKMFADNVERASAALALALDADITALRTYVGFEPFVLPTLDSIASVALTRIDYPKNPTIEFRGSASVDRNIEIVSEKTGNLVIRICAAATPKPADDGGEAATGIELSSSTPGQPMASALQDVIAQAEDRTAQSMLQQFMLMRHWLNDRFARLSSMYNGEKAAADDAARNLDDIVEWLIRLFDADFAAIYHVSGDGILEEVAHGSRSSERSKQAAAENSRHMRELAAAEPKQRKLSSAYRALQSASSQDVPDWDGALHENGMSAPDTLGDPRPRSTVAAPITILGRTWGVVELIGFCANQFDKISSMWIEEASQLVGNALYHTWLLKQVTQANLAVLLDRQATEIMFDNDDERDRRLIVTADSGKEARTRAIRNDICREMAELFIADGAALWLNNEVWPGRLYLGGFFGVDFDPERDAPPGLPDDAPRWPEIDMNSDDALVPRVMREGMRAGEAPPAESLDEPRGEPVNARYAYRKALWRSGVRRVTLMPLLETSSAEEARPIGALALYSKTSNGDPEPYGRRWLPLIEFAGRHVAMLVRSIALESERQTSLELMFSHEVIGSLRRVRDQFEYLETHLLGPLSRNRTIEALQSPDRLRDISKAASRVENGIAEAVDRLEEMRRDGFKMPSPTNLSFRSHAAWDGVPAVLFNAIQSGFNARYKFRVSRQISWRPTGTTEFIRIAANPRDLETLFYNLADNAIKYSSKGSEIRVNIERRQTGNLYVDFINEGPPLRPGEADRLFKLGFRGQRARNLVEDGDGQGLFITQQLAQTLGIGLQYNAVPVSGISDVEHRFRLIFTKEQVIYGRK